jgi:hypothetical protein
MFVRGIGIRDISVIEQISIKKVLSVPVNSDKIITPRQQHYDYLEVDEFWSYVGTIKRIRFGSFMLIIVLPARL